MVYSGKLTKKTTLYDRFIISLEGSFVQSSNIEKSLDFYTGILDFTPLRSTDTNQPLGLLLPGKKKLFFSEPLSSREISSTSTHTLKVRNGFDKLHQRIVERSKQPSIKFSLKDKASYSQLPPGRVSEIIQRPWGREFVVRDPDGNNLIFYRPTRRLGKRY